MVLQCFSFFFDFATGSNHSDARHSFCNRWDSVSISRDSNLLDKIISRIKDARGIDLSGYRRTMLGRRLNARMAMVQCQDPEAYLKRLQNDPAECDQLIDAIAINVSSFFRDPIVWEILAESVLPDTLHRKRRAGSKEIRVWCAGCAAGEEAYSIAILIHRALDGEFAEWTVHLFGTDVDKACLKKAQAGFFPRESLRDTKLGIIDQYFETSGDGYMIRPCIRKMVRFSHDDLVSPDRDTPVDSVFGTFDIVLCRNLLIYFSRNLQNSVLGKLYRSLSVGGHLVLGESEMPTDETTSWFAEVNRRHRLFRRRFVK